MIRIFLFQLGLLLISSRLVNVDFSFFTNYELSFECATMNLVTLDPSLTSKFNLDQELIGKRKGKVCSI